MVSAHSARSSSRPPGDATNTRRPTSSLGTRAAYAEDQAAVVPTVVVPWGTHLAVWLKDVLIGYGAARPIHTVPGPTTELRSRVPAFGRSRMIVTGAIVRSSAVGASMSAMGFVWL